VGLLGQGGKNSSRGGSTRTRKKKSPILWKKSVLFGFWKKGAKAGKALIGKRVFKRRGREGLTKLGRADLGTSGYGSGGVNKPALGPEKEGETTVQKEIREGHLGFSRPDKKREGRWGKRVAPGRR